MWTFINIRGGTGISAALYKNQETGKYVIFDYVRGTEHQFDTRSAAVSFRESIRKR